MTRGRGQNHPRDEARTFGAATFEAPACLCGCTSRYTSSGACVDCSIARGKARYTGSNRETIIAQDAARYQRRKANGA